MVEDFVNAIPTSDVDEFRMVWGQHSDVLNDARGLFVVDNPLLRVLLARQSRLRQDWIPAERYGKQ